MVDLHDVEFKSGQKLLYVELPEADLYSLGKSGIVDIRVIMENGQMAGVPWALVEFHNGRICKLNLSMAKSVELLVEKD